MQDFHKLKVYQEAHALTLATYVASRGFPRDELFALTSQLRRAVSSIELNICEGCGVSTRRGFARYIDTACGSTSETEGALLIARDLGYLKPATYDDLHVRVTAVKKMLNSFLRRLREEESD